MNNRTYASLQHVYENPIAIKYFIFYEVNHGVPVFVSYKNFCARYGPSVISYPDYEFWYMRIYNGDFDMNYDRTNDPIMRGLMEMPPEIHKMIESNLNFMERLVLRKVSKYFRDFVDSADPGFKHISLETNDQQSVVRLDDYYIFYNQTFSIHPNGYYNSSTTVLCGTARPRIVKFSNHLELAINDISVLLKNPKLKLINLFLKTNSSSGIETKIGAMMKSLGRKIDTKNVEIVTHYSKGEMAILPFINPDGLDEVVLNFIDQKTLQTTNEDYKRRLFEIGNLEQCRRAKTLRVNLNYYYSSWFSLEYFTNCNNLRLNINLRIDKVSIFDVNQFMKVILRSKSLNYFCLFALTNFTKRAFIKKLSKTAANVDDEPFIHHIKIPKSSDYMEVMVEGPEDYIILITMTRKQALDS